MLKDFLGIDKEIKELEDKLAAVKNRQQQGMSTIACYLLNTPVPECELRQLKCFAADKPFMAHWSDNFISELRHLASLGLIERYNGRSISDLEKELGAKRNLKRNQEVDVGVGLRITEAGRRYLDVREKFLEMLK